MESREDRLFRRAWLILDGKAPGFGLPILRHLALRGYGAAMLELANRDTSGGQRAELGRLSDSASPFGQFYRAYRGGADYAAQNLAMTFFNVGELARYRHWLHRAARAGDLDARAELRRFETRKPHRLAWQLRRGRPCRRDGD